MIGARLVFLVAVLAVCSLTPGFLFVRKFRWSPLEKLCGSIALSLILLYLAAFGIYLLKLPTWAYWCVSGLCAAAGAACIRGLARMLRARQVRRPLAGFGFLLVWTALLFGLVRNYSGGGWGGDWFEHYHRTIFFLERLPTDTVIYGNYAVPARPPMMNLLAAHFLAHAPQPSFQAYQVVFGFLNLLIFLPCCLITRALVRRGGRRIRLLLALFAVCPMFMQNVTYTWTKLLSGFYVVLAIWLYLAAWRKNDGLRTISAMVCLAAGALVHYSVGPYIVLIALHFGVLVLLRLRARWRRAVAAAVLSGALLATWLGWSLATYGVAGTFTSNTAVIAAKKTVGGNAARIAANAFDTLVPHSLRGDANIDMFSQPNELGYARDQAFLIYQTCFIPAMGCVGGLAVVCVFIWSMLARSWPARAGERAFWLMMAIGGLALGISVVGERETFGVAHICLPTLVFIGLALLAGAFGRLPRLVRGLIVLGWAFDFAVGVFLHFRLQNMTFRIWQEGARQFADSPDGPLLSNVALGNWFLKESYGAVFLGDLFAGFSAAIQVAVVGLFLLMAAALIREAVVNRRPAAGGGLAAGRPPRSTIAGSGAARQRGRSGSARRGGRTRGRGPAPPASR